MHGPLIATQIHTEHYPNMVSLNKYVHVLSMN